MSQKNIKWTDQQSRAIIEHNRNVLVSASAGTGKTAVLSGSCVDIVTNRETCPDVWCILVLTFTDMAAEQMRSRIAQQLNAAIEASRDNILKQHLRRQLILLGAADISTIHSFCKRLITEHFYELDLDPTFRVIDADESKLLKAEALEKTIDFCWKQNNLSDALRQLLSRRNLRTIDGFPSAIIEISDFLDSVVSRDDWLNRAKALAETADPFTTDLARAQKKIIDCVLTNIIRRIQYAEKIYQSASGNKNTKFEDSYIKPVAHLLDVLNSDNWASFIEAIHNYPKPRVETPKDIDKGPAGLVKDMVKEAVDSVDKVCDLAVLNPDYLAKFAGAVGSQTMVLIELVRNFDNFYRQAKTALNCLDFADLEHYALRLLAAEKSLPSQTALKLRKKYKYIFVDEYQDINSVQQTILDMLSSAGNIFAVGDPKQSIYQWRGANPEIFIKNLNRASTRPADSESGLRVDLNINFRSVKGILDFVNLVFSRIMTASFANMDYDEAAHLKPATKIENAAKTAPACPACPERSRGEQSRRAVELHIIDKPQRNAEQDDTAENEQTENESSQLFSSRQLQASLIAQRIKQMLGADTGKPELLIPDKLSNGQRPVAYRDIVILMRSLAGRNDFIESLRLSGIPVSCEATAGYFQATEITDMLSLLKVLDNPRRDIELAAVLRSPLFVFTDTDLAKIRLWGKKNTAKSGFYDCVIGCSESPDDPELSGKLKVSLSTLDNWRTLARRGRLAELIWHIYRQTGFLSFVCALPQADARRANLLKLHDRAIQFENFVSGSGVPSLTRFIDFIEKLLAAGQDWAPAEPESAAGNAVRVLSVHKSKGLEFPVVFLADINSEFSKKESRRDCLLDEQLTLGLQIIDPQSNSRLDSLAYQVIEENNRRKSLAEEMRILYVAMTRAIDRLVLVGCKDKNSCLRILNSASLFDTGPVPDWYLDDRNSHLDWLLSALSRQPSLHDAFQTSHKAVSVPENLFSVQFYNHLEAEKLSVFIKNAKRVKIINYQLSIL